MEIATANSLFQLWLGVFQRLSSGVFQRNPNHLRVLLGFSGDDTDILLPELAHLGQLTHLPLDGGEILAGVEMAGDVL